MRLPPAVADAVRRHAERTFPEECCGILIGRHRRNDEHEPGGATVVDTAMPAENVAAGDRRSRYDIDARALLRAHREARETGREVVGYYHSHPLHPAVPSARDREHAWPGVGYLIVAVDPGGAAAEIRCWRLDGDGDWREQSWSTYPT